MDRLLNTPPLLKLNDIHFRSNKFWGEGLNEQVICKIHHFLVFYIYSSLGQGPANSTRTREEAFQAERGVSVCHSFPAVTLRVKARVSRGNAMDMLAGAWAGSGTCRRHLCGGTAMCARADPAGSPPGPPPATSFCHPAFCTPNLASVSAPPQAFSKPSCKSHAHSFKHEKIARWRHFCTFYGGGS